MAILRDSAVMSAPFAGPLFSPVKSSGGLEGEEGGEEFGGDEAVFLGIPVGGETGDAAGRLKQLAPGTAVVGGCGCGRPGVSAHGVWRWRRAGRRRLCTNTTSFTNPPPVQFNNNIRLQKLPVCCAKKFSLQRRRSPRRRRELGGYHAFSRLRHRYQLPMERQGRQGAARVSMWAAPGRTSRP